MHRYRTGVRVVFGVAFLLGGLAHLLLGRLDPDGYAAFGETALVPALERFWSDFVMPNIGTLTVVLGGLELAVGLALLSGGRSARLAAVAVLGFFAFILVLGYGVGAQGLVEDLLKNRAFTLVMAALIVPVALRRASRREPKGVRRLTGSRRVARSIVAKGSSRGA